tara:strand:- start:3701 stop:4057 length:357 start_codon:yes stop_codon:yes gene_type:complete
MRFLEFQNSNKQLLSALMNTLNQLRGEANEKDQSSQISFDAVTSIMKNTGFPTFNYDLFKQMYDQGDELKKVVKDFDREKIVIQTEKDAETDPEMDFDNQGSTDVVKKMAKSAMNRRK